MKNLPKTTQATLVKITSSQFIDRFETLLLLSDISTERAFHLREALQAAADAAHDRHEVTKKTGTKHLTVTDGVRLSNALDEQMKSLYIAILREETARRILDSELDVAALMTYHGIAESDLAKDVDQWFKHL